MRARIGVVPQADNLDPDFSVVENLRVYASYFGLSRRATEARIATLLDFAALINEPELVVLDEPTTGLDPQARHVIWGRLAELRERGTTLILTTHYMEEAERLCDELVIMDHGRILDCGSPAELIQRHVEPELVEVRGDAGESFVQLARTQGCRLERMGTSLYCYTSEPAPLLAKLQAAHGVTFLHRPAGLEDVFLRLTGRELRD